MDTKPSPITPLAGYVVVQLELIFFATTLGVIEQHRLGDMYRDSIMPYTGILFDVAGVLIFTSVAVHLGWQYFLNWKCRCMTTLMLILFYVSSYSLLSFQGKYHGSRSGTNRWTSTGLAIVDQELWHAKGVFWQPFQTVDGTHTFQATSLGYFYSPLIRLDRAYVHKTTILFENN